MGAHSSGRAPDPRKQLSPLPPVPVLAVCSCGARMDEGEFRKHLRDARFAAIEGAFFGPDPSAYKISDAVEAAVAAHHLERLAAWSAP